MLKVNIPRNDLRVTINQRPAPTPFGFGGWVALTKGQGMDVMLGDLVLTEDEVNPVMSALLRNGLDVTALHNHFFWEQPRIFHMHMHGMGSASDLAKRVKPAIDLIDQAAKKAAPPSAQAQSSPLIDGAALATIIGTPGEQTGPVYKITIGRPDIDLREHGAPILVGGVLTSAAQTTLQVDQTSVVAENSTSPTTIESVEACRAGLTNAGRSATFAGIAVYQMTSDSQGKVTEIKALKVPDSFSTFVQVAEFRGCLQPWRFNDCQRSIKPLSSRKRAA